MKKRSIKNGKDIYFGKVPNWFNQMSQEFLNEYLLNLFEGYLADCLAKNKKFMHCKNCGKLFDEEQVRYLPRKHLKDGYIEVTLPHCCKCGEVLLS